MAAFLSNTERKNLAFNTHCSVYHPNSVHSLTLISYTFKRQGQLFLMILYVKIKPLFYSVCSAGI